MLRSSFAPRPGQSSPCLDVHVNCVLYHSQETINMFERNIVDLVGTFIENVQSLYPFLCDLPWGGAVGPMGLS